MPQLNDLSRSLVILEQDATLIAVIEMGQSNWLVAGIVPGVERSPLKKLAVDESARLLGSIAAEGSPRIGRTAIEKRLRFCTSPQFGSCSENSVIRPKVSGQPLKTDRRGSLVVNRGVETELICQ